MKIMRVVAVFIMALLVVIGVCGCMDNSKLYGTKTRKESDQEYAQMMLRHLEKKYNKDFEIIQYIFPEEGFNTNHVESFLTVREMQSGTVTNMYATLGDPYTYYDNYVSDYASWINRKMVDCTALDGLGTTKLYLYLRELEVNEPDISKENVSRVVLLVNITRKPDTETLEKLYGVYQELFSLDYEYIFLVAAFTEHSENFDNYVQSYRVFGKKNWEDYEGEIYATLSVKEAGLTFDAFENLCIHK